MVAKPTHRGDPIRGDHSTRPVEASFRCCAPTCFHAGAW
nr:MAG TPA: hypothetical protein [Caudoviricetes sp.]